MKTIFYSVAFSVVLVSVVLCASDRTVFAEDDTALTERFSYTSAGKVDPFRPLVSEERETRQTTRVVRDTRFLTPLQRYDLDDLKLVAVVISNNEPTAMLEDPTGYGYVVRRGMLVGQNEGVVERVMPSSVIVREKIYNAQGDVETRLSTITMKRSE